MSVKPATTPDPGEPVSLPADRSFVLQFRADSGSGPGRPWTGRVEHVVSGRAARFDDCATLREFIAAVLAEHARPTARPETRE
jgi:hypothetical protein